MRRWPRLLAVILLLPWLMASTYKWTDGKGVVHLSDQPPPAGTPYEIIQTPGSPPAPAPKAPAAGDAGSAGKVPTASPPVSAPTRRNDEACVAALYQIDLLRQPLQRVYKRVGTDFVYLDDRDRPAELERLAHMRDASCSDDADVRTAQRLRAADMAQGLSLDCREARERLANMQRPTSHTSAREIERQQESIAARCPESPDEGIWVADWVRPGDRRLH